MVNKSAPHRTTRQLNDVIKSHFTKINKDSKFLDSLAVDDKSLYVSLVLKTIPNAIAIDVSHHLDLSLAMRQANERLDTYNKQTIDHLPGANLAASSLQLNNQNAETLENITTIIVADENKIDEVI
tara:strand:+ start:228 stop:605 length:378 start_codon:yes stop_codon:yes gene_type:complete